MPMRVHIPVSSLTISPPPESPGQEVSLIRMVMRERMMAMMTMMIVIVIAIINRDVSLTMITMMAMVMMIWLPPRESHWTYKKLDTS